ncbi:site-specific integrase [Citrobacter amalonaticus]|nr:site-specific integrase [Citrobacter amalonaticus]
MTRKRAVTLRYALDKYVNTVSNEKKGWRQELYRANVIKRYEISDLLMNEISSVDISNYRDERLNSIHERTKKKISGNTVRLELAFLSSVFKLAQVEWGVCKTNPVLVVRKPKIGKGRERRLLKNEEKKITKYFECLDVKMNIIFHLALETAMRQGEILGLLWENVNLSIGVAHLPETKNGTWRDVPLSKRARELLLCMQPKTTGRIFSFTSNSFKSKWRKSIKSLGIVDLRFHDLRHEAISRFFELGTLNMIEIASISGHKSLSMLKRYTHLRAYQLVKKIDSKAKTVNKIASYFVPYPALVESIDGEYILTFIDFDSFEVIGSTKNDVIVLASIELLKRLAVAAQSGKKIPSPGQLGKVTENMILINPLM